MTDRLRTKDFLDSLEIPYTEEVSDTKNIATRSTITLETGSTKVTGYKGFIADFYFDENGKFINMGIYE
ncbi:hypothetical protein BH09PAT1_BH09PAT1_8560 [soil metagenome]